MAGSMDQLRGENESRSGLLGAMRGRFGAAFAPMRGDGLRARALRGSGWTLAGFGAQQVLRLGSNLVLTRLLFPEAFGLMALAQVFLQGLNMLSDIGVGPSIVQNKRGDDPDFLATAWTMQVIRGFALFLGMCALAYPASLIYKQPLLFPILLLLGTTSVIVGFQSIGISTASRKMAISRLTLLDLISQVAGITVMVVWAAITRDIWALVGGGVVAAAVRLLLGYILFPSSGNRFHFERSAAHEIFHFGKWIFLATAMTYFGGQGIRLFQGMLVPVDVLGLIAIAGSLAAMLKALIGKLGSSVMFPIFSETYRNRPEQLRRHLAHARNKIFILTFPLYAVLIVFGNDLVHLLYDPRYSAAGLYLIIMATGSAIVSLRLPFGMTLLSVGDSFGHSLNMSVMSAARIAAVVVGFAAGGVIGMLIADVVADLIVYPFEAWRLNKHCLWMPRFDLICFGIYLALGVFSLSRYI